MKKLIAMTKDNDELKQLFDEMERIKTVIESRFNFISRQADKIKKDADKLKDDQWVLIKDWLEKNNLMKEEHKNMDLEFDRSLGILYATDSSENDALTKLMQMLHGQKP